MDEESITKIQLSPVLKDSQFKQFSKKDSQEPFNDLDIFSVKKPQDFKEVTEKNTQKESKAPSWRNFLDIQR